MVLLNLIIKSIYSALDSLLTFHYGAIEPILLNPSATMLVTLTFHYGAIEPPLALKPLYI